MATAIDAVLAEISDKRAVLTPQYEGLQDYQRLNLKPETQQEITTSLAQYARRLSLMETAEAAIKALQDDGHPVMDPRNITDAAFSDLVINSATIQSALGQFKSDKGAETLELERLRASLQGSSGRLSDSVAHNQAST